VRTTLLVLFNESRKRFLIVWDYKFDVVVQMVMIGVIFIGASFFLGAGQFNAQQLATLFLGYAVWFYARVVIMSTTADLLGEAQSGTLEQMYMTPAPTEALILGRMLAMLVTTTIMVLLTCVGLVLLLHITLPIRWEGLPVLLITLAGLFGFTLVLAGATLVFKRTEALADLLQNALLFLSGSLLPIERFPAWLAFIARALPITQGIDVLRNVMLNGQSLSATWNDGSLIWLILHSALYLSVGWLVFKWGERVAKRQGSLGHY